VTLIDSHCHIGHLAEDAGSVLAEAAAAGVGTVIDIGMGTEESAAAARRAVELAPRVYATVGIHPNDVTEYERSPAKAMAALRVLATQPGVVGIGETGLDHYRDRSPAELQERAFLAHIALAIETDRTLVIHCRDAHDRLLEVLGSTDEPARIVMHCFSGDGDFARVCAERGYFCSFAGNLTYKRNDELRAIAKTLPKDLLLIETDAPFLAPQLYRGKSNKPAYLRLTAEVLAQTLDMPLVSLAEVLEKNTKRAFALD
jgi:TatD DNase family protein